MKRLPILLVAILAFLTLFLVCLPCPCDAAPAAPAIPASAEVVEFSKLIPLLPKTPEGWTAEPAEGSTTDSGGSKLTSVGCNYTKGEGDTASTAVVNIIDSSDRQFLDATTAGWNISQETTEGYTKSIKIDENPGFETFDKAGKSGSIWVMVAKRFILHIDLTNLPPEDLQKWARSVDLKKLTQLK